MKQGLKIALIAFAASAALIKGAPALAEQTTPDVSVSVVHTADLDLTTDAGRRALDVRLSRAAREVCGEASDVDLAGKNKVRACRDTVLADARARTAQLASRGGPIVLAAR
ncbi:MAG TPA: UrcA family protein [Sphingomicrobium sp.]|nr:UrcA family protein [Sphingomicrobium sp.]